MTITASARARADKAHTQHMQPLHTCPACGAALEIAAGCAFSTRAGERVKRLPVWCSTCGEHLVVVYRLSGSNVKVTVEKQKGT